MFDRRPHPLLLRFVRKGILRNAVGRPPVVCLIGLMLLLWAAVPAYSASQPLPSADTSTAEGNWFSRELLRLKSFPHLDMAYRLLAQGRRAEAIKELQQYLELVPGDLKVQEMFITVLADEGRLNDALGRSDTILETSEGQWRLRLVRANLLQRMGRYAAAAEDYALLLRETALDKEAQRQVRAGYAASLLKTGQYSQALETLNALPDQAGDIVLPTLRAQALVNLKRIPEAVRLLEKTYANAATAKDKADVLVFWAQALTDLGDLAGAGKLLQECLDVSPENPAALRALAENAIKLKEPEKAVAFAKRADAAEASPAVRELYANTLMAAGRPAEAADIFRELAASSGNRDVRSRFIIRQGYALSAAGKDQEAAEAFALAADQDKSEAAYEGLAASLERLGRFDEAAKAIQKAVDESPTATLLFRLAGLKSKAGKPEEAARDIESALAKGLAGDLRGMAEDELGEMFIQAGKDKEALDIWKTALARRPGDAALLSRMAVVSQRLGDMGLALSYAQAAQKASPNLETTTALAVLTALSGQPGKAAELLRQALAMVKKNTPEEADLLERLATLEAMAGRHAVAAELFVNAYDARGRGPSDLLAKASGEYLDAGQIDKAQAVLGRLLQMSGLSPAVRSVALARSAAVALRQGDTAQAERFYREALELGGLPRNMKADALAILAGVEQRNGHTDKALELLSQAMKEGIPAWRARFSMGTALFQAKRYDQALTQLQLAAQDSPGERIQLAIARCYEALNKPGLAIHTMLTVNPDRTGFNEGERREYYAALGNLYAQTDDTQNAAAAYRKSLAIRNDPAVAIRLARMERLNGNPEEALRLLQTVKEQTMPGVSVAPTTPPPPPGLQAAKEQRPPRQSNPPLTQAAPDAAAATAQKQDAGQASSTRRPQPLGEGSPPQASVPAPAEQGARVMQDVIVTDASDGVVILFKGVAPDVQAKTFVIEGQNRIVVDLPGIWKVQGQGNTFGTGGLVQRMRMAQHPDKFRVVFDLSGKPGKPVVSSSSEGLVVRFGK